MAFLSGHEGTKNETGAGGEVRIRIRIKVIATIIFRKKAIKCKLNIFQKGGGGTD